MGNSYNVTHIRGSVLYAPHVASDPEGSVKEWGTVVATSDTHNVKREGEDSLTVDSPWSVGKRVWFSWNFNNETSRFVHEGVNYLKIDGNYILAYERGEGKVYPAPDHFFAEEPPVDTVKGTAATKTESGLYVGVDELKKRERKSRFRKLLFVSSGRPLDEDNDPMRGIQQGQEVLVLPMGLTKIHIEGRVVYVGQTRDMIMSLDD